MNKIIRYLSASILVLFGLLTLFLTTSVIFDLFGIRAKEGNYLLIVVWANFVSSFLYFAVAYGFIYAKKWTTKLLGACSILLSLAFIALMYHINSGGSYEKETIVGMILRLTITIAFTGTSYFSISNKNRISN
jgi:hypothetical protein